ncbi:hypothetical protein EC912_10233 [Luteibacter rhizovicinus]|uniref:G domain-containing protein n=1 Tax=Luteibacter rhizovicinus TaxID=242606 RepID=A0A4R3YT67_9GAMM|nr:GTPase [Luteibacter rhizovicinus]TCV95690.1 hypothetical protein EC912_10233 [Luteibacter rhizovicinus]
MSRRMRLLISAIGLAALAWLVLAAFDRLLSLAQRYMTLPEALRIVIAVILAIFLIAGGGVLWWLFGRHPARRPVSAPDRSTLETRIEAVSRLGGDTGDLSAELRELDRRRAGERVYVALFGDISTGKSSLVAALCPGTSPPSDVLGGTTREVGHYEGQLPDGRPLTLADVPGSHEADGEAVERMARDEVLRAHAVVYLCAGDLSRTQAADVRWLGDFGKPMLLALNKADQWTDAERATLTARLRTQADGIPDTVIAISAGGTERFTRELADGTIEQVQRQRRPQLAPLYDALDRVLAPGAEGLEAQRQNAVLAGLHQKTGEREAEVRAAEASRIVTRYSRRAIVGAMAAVAPGSDLLIQGVLAAGLVRALAALYDVRVSDVQVEELVRQARLTLRTGTSIVLAIAGNALKAFPGLGTLGGGVLHAFAYALVFDSLGKALAASLAQCQTLDQRDATDRMKDLLQDEDGSRLRRLAALTSDALRNKDAM